MDSTDEEIKMKEFLCKTFPLGDASEVAKAKEVFHELQEKYNKLQKEICDCKEMREGSDSDVVNMLLQAQAAEEKTKKLIKKAKQCDDEAKKLFTPVEPLIDQVEATITKISHAEKLQSYLTMLSHIDRITDDMRSNLSVDSEPLLMSRYSDLCELCESLSDSGCRHLVRYINQTTVAWYNYIKDKWTKEYEELLKSIHWPWIEQTRQVNQPQPTREQIQRFDALTVNMLKLKMPQQLDRRESLSSKLMEDFPPLVLPLQLLVKPLKKRFLYHFYGKRQTNNVNKPEWYLTQTLSWLKSCLGFVENTVQPCLEKAGFGPVKAKVEFTRGLVALVVEKLHSCVAELDDVTLSHTIDETLLFYRELSELPVLYPSSQPGVLGVLTQAACFQRWLLLEKKYATEKMDCILSCDTAWQVEDSDDNDLVVTECGDALLTLLLTITERYKLLPQPGHRLQFLELQLSLLDDFRVRILQLMSAETLSPLHAKSSYVSLLNTVDYVMNVVEEWSELPFFLQLQYFRKKFESGGDVLVEETAFEKILVLFGHVKTELYTTLVDCLMMEVKARSRPYRKDKWFALPAPQGDVSPTAAPLFQELSLQLSSLRQRLSSHCYSLVWQSVAKSIDMYLYEEVILSNRFSEGGATQLQFDITRGLFPIFVDYTKKPDNYFSFVKESVILLTLARGSAILLREALAGADTHPQSALKDIQVYNIIPRDALRILDSRMSTGLLID